MAIPENYIDKITKDGESRDICPAADKVRVGNENFGGTNLDDVLNEIAEEMDNAGDGTVTGVKVGDTTYEPTEGVVDLSTPFGNKVDKVPGKGLSTNDYTTEEKTKLAGLPTNPVQSISVNGQTQQKDNGNVNIVVPSGGLTESDISVETQGDGTVDINVGSDTYTINLNHTHENMAKLVVCEESDLPSTLDNSTIYAITDSGETEIEKLIIHGMEFVGGGVPDTGEPMISSPSNGSTINLGTNEGSGVSKTITVKGKNLTGDLTVSVGTGLEISYGQTLNGSSVTIPMAQALLGAQVTIAYSGSGTLDDGSLVISQGNDVLSSVVVVVVAPVQVTGVKLTGTQWLRTDYNVNANTKVVMRCTFAANGNTETSSNFYFLSCKEKNVAAGYNCCFYAGKNTSTQYNLCGLTNTPPTIIAVNKSVLTVENSTFEFYGSTMKFTPNGGSAITGNLAQAIASMPEPIHIGYYISPTDQSVKIWDAFNLTIYELTISEGNEVKRHYVPATLGGVPGLYDTETGAFISSMVEGEPLEVVQ